MVFVRFKLPCFHPQVPKTPPGDFPQGRLNLRHYFLITDKNTPRGAIFPSRGKVRYDLNVSLLPGKILT